MSRLRALAGRAYAALAFGRAAAVYELLTDHEAWRRDCRDMAELVAGPRVLDLGVGPGTSALEMARADPARRHVGLDVSAAMLRRAARRARAARRRPAARPRGRARAARPRAARSTPPPATASCTSSTTPPRRSRRCAARCGRAGASRSSSRAPAARGSRERAAAAARATASRWRSGAACPASTAATTRRRCRRSSRAPGSSGARAWPVLVGLWGDGNRRSRPEYEGRPRCARPGPSSATSTARPSPRTSAISSRYRFAGVDELPRRGGRVPARRVPVQRAAREGVRADHRLARGDRGVRARDARCSGPASRRSSRRAARAAARSSSSPPGLDAYIEPVLERLPPALRAPRGGPREPRASCRRRGSRSRFHGADCGVLRLLQGRRRARAAGRRAQGASSAATAPATGTPPTPPTHVFARAGSRLVRYCAERGIRARRRSRRSTR